jgi:hypothetical protein
MSWLALPPRPAIIQPAPKELILPREKRFALAPAFSPGFIQPQFSAVTLGTVTTNNQTTDSTTTTFATLTGAITAGQYPIFCISGRAASAPNILTCQLGVACRSRNDGS